MSGHMAEGLAVYPCPYPRLVKHYLLQTDSGVFIGKSRISETRSAMIVTSLILSRYIKLMPVQMAVQVSPGGRPLASPRASTMIILVHFKGFFQTECFSQTENTIKMRESRAMKNVFSFSKFNTKSCNWMWL